MLEREGLARLLRRFEVRGEGLWRRPSLLSVSLRGLNGSEVEALVGERSNDGFTGGSRLDAPQAGPCRLAHEMA